MRVRDIRKRFQAKGFSLVELLVAMAIMGLVMGSVAMVFGSHTRSQMFGNERLQTRQNARIALLMIQRDIRAAGSNVFFEVNPLGPVFCDDGMPSQGDPCRDNPEGEGCAGEFDSICRDAAFGYPFLSIGGTGTDEAAPYRIRRSPPYAPEEIIHSHYPLNETTTNTDGSLVNQRLRINRLTGPAYETNSALHFVGGTSTNTLNLDPSISASERPDPEWKNGTMVLVIGETEDGNFGVVRKITGGSFPTYNVADDGSCFNADFAVGSVTANQVVAGARMVMEINRTVEYTLDTTTRTLKFQDMLYDDYPRDVVEGISSIRLLMASGNGYVPFNPAARPSRVRIEVESLTPEGDPVTVSGIAELRNY